MSGKWRIVKKIQRIPDGVTKSTSSVHAFWALVDDQGNVVAELHGWATNPETNEAKQAGLPFDNSDILKVFAVDPNLPAGGENGLGAQSGSTGETRILGTATLFVGTQEEVLLKWAQALAERDRINAEARAYSPDGQFAPNSNSVADRLAYAMGVPNKQLFNDKDKDGRPDWNEEIWNEPGSDYYENQGLYPSEPSYLSNLRPSDESFNANCFCSGAPILMGDGTVKPIENIRVGDEVSAYDICNGIDAPLEAKRVVRLFSNESGDLVNLDGVLVTRGRRFLTTSGRFETLGEIVQTGASLVSADGAPTRLPTIKNVDEVHKTYNFEVEDHHTYVAGGFRVHNESWLFAHRLNLDVSLIGHVTDEGVFEILELNTA